MTTRLRAVVVALAMTSAGAHVPLTRAEPAPVAGWMITRTGRGRVPLTGRFTGSAASAEATAVLFALTGAAAKRRMSGAFTTGRIDWGTDGWPRVYGVTPECPGVVCSTPAGVPTSYGFSSNGHPTDATILIATSSVQHASVEVTSPGWRVRPWTPTMRIVTTEEAGDRGARALHMSVGNFTEARAAGGKHGSLAWAYLPCEDRGEGRATLAGGTRVWSLACPNEPSALAETPRGTAWRFHGSASGMSAVVNVLVVVDFPKP